ncbi:hypothetical protein ABZ465_18925 [Streptomyces griseoincarnatus]
MRAVAGRTAGVVSHSTVHQTLSGRRIPRWGALELIVEALGGDPMEFHPLWKQLRVQARQVPVGSASKSVQSPGYRFKLAMTRHTPQAGNLLILERTRQIKGADGPLAAARYLEKKIGASWNSPLVATYIQLLEEAGQEGKVAEIVPHFRGIEMRSAEASNVVAEIFDELEEYAEAARHGRAALRQDPNNARYAWLLGTYLESMDMLDEALVYYELAHRLKPKDYDFVESYLDSLLEKSQFAKAEEVARTCWEQESLRVYAGISLALQGNFLEAESVLTSISKLASNGVRALAQVRVALDRREDALALLAGHLEKSPNDLNSGAMYAELLRDAGSTEKYSEALRRLEAGIARENERVAAVMAKIRAAKQGQ